MLGTKGNSLNFEIIWLENVIFTCICYCTWISKCIFWKWLAIRRVIGRVFCVNRGLVVAVFARRHSQSLIGHKTICFSFFCSANHLQSRSFLGISQKVRYKTVCANPSSLFCLAGWRRHMTFYDAWVYKKKSNPFCKSDCYGRLRTTTIY